MNFKLKLKSCLQRLFSQTSGNVAMIFALSIIPILSVAGFAIDFQMTATRKNKVQVVIDSAVLAGARAMQANKTQQEISQTVTAYINAQLDTVGSSLHCNTPSVNWAQGSQDLSVDILCKQDTSLMRIIGKDDMPFKVSSTSTWGIGKLDVAFMFDVSGSMGGSSRITHLKAAAHDALDTLLPAGGGVATQDVRIAMISYNDMHNAGDHFEDVTGLKPTRTYYAENTYEVRNRIPPYTENYQNWECQREWKCTARYTRGRRKGQCKRGYWQDGNCGYVTRERDVYNYETVEMTEEKSKTITSTCVWERYGDHEFSDFAPDFSVPGEPALITAKNKIYDAENKIYNASESPDNPQGYMSAGYARWNQGDPADRYDGWWSTDGTSCRNHKPVPLTNNRTTLTSYIDSLTTGGGTAGHQGIAWARYMVAEPWQTIFTGSGAPMDYTEPDSVKAIILMSDGEFLHNEFGNMGTSTEQARRVCDSIKERGHIVIYSVAFQAPQAGKDILDYCASGPEYSFAPENGQQLTEAYTAIATSISDLRVKF